jgi:HD-GYP domain-containing protein (c-di-GMP phosphodiesterase class II)
MPRSELSENQSNIDIHQQQDDFLRTLLSLIQTAKIHDDKYELLQENVVKFKGIILEFCAEDEDCTLQISRGRVYLQGEKIAFRRQNKSLLENILHLFEKRRIPGLRFHRDISEITPPEILSLVRDLDKAGQEEEPLEWFDTKIQQLTHPWVELIAEQEQAPGESDTGVEGDDGQDPNAQRRERARRDYSYLLYSFKEVGQKLSSNKRPGIRKSIRLIQNMVDHILEDDEIFSAMSTLRVFDDYTFTHSVNVGILSMTIGKRIGLSKTSLERLGLCALFHDLGKLEVPKEILNKPGKLNDDEYETMEKHSLDSARLIVKLRASAERKAKLLLPPFEHHLKYDLSGYPHAGWERPISLFGRIITIADVYDAITSPRVYRKSVMSPDRALGYMLNGSGIDFDPILLKVFINIMGVYPVGTLVTLDTGELCLVKETGKDTEAERPLVVSLIENADGEYLKGDEIDLTERNSQSGKFLRNIATTKHPASLGIQPVQFIT